MQNLGLLKFALLQSRRWEDEWANTTLPFPSKPVQNSAHQTALKN